MTKAANLNELHTITTLLKMNFLPNSEKKKIKQGKKRERTEIDADFGFHHMHHVIISANTANWITLTKIIQLNALVVQKQQETASRSSNGRK